jgi:membrane-associated phospholipid phosphatase
VRLSRALRISAWALVAAGVAAPVARRRMKIPRAAVAATAWSAPVALCVALPRTRTRDVGMLMLQMWAYVAMYEMPADDPEALEARVHVDYPVAVDRVLGLGELPGVRLQRRLARADGRLRAPEKVLVWAHWVWFMVPHGTATYVLLRRREQFPRAATLIYATFDLGVLFYWLTPTAPPWYAAEHGRMGPAEAGSELRLRRLMLGYGEQFWGDNWHRLYDGLAGNPLAAMPSLHFATSVMSAHVLADVGPGHGAAGWAYTATLGTALVYLGEHYVVDLLAGLALVAGIRAAAPAATPLLRGFSRAVQQLEQRAHSG